MNLFPSNLYYPSRISTNGVNLENQRLYSMLHQLSTKTKLDPQGVVQFDEDFIKMLVSIGEPLVPPLAQFIAYQVNQGPYGVVPLVAGLYTAQQLAQAKVTGVKNIFYNVTSHWRTPLHPLVDIYLAGFYRHLQLPETTGHLIEKTYQYLQKGPVGSTWNPLEELGGALQQNFAEKAAEETIKRLWNEKGLLPNNKHKN